MSQSVLPRPIIKLRMARYLLLFVVVIRDMFLNEGLVDIFKEKLLRINDVEFSSWDNDVILAQTKNLDISALCTCFLIFDDVLNEEFGKRPKHFKNTDLDSLRAIVYMLRCSVAHITSAPQWKVSRDLRRVIRINEIDYELDARSLNGEKVAHKDYGKIAGVLKLMDYAEKLVEQHQKSA